MTDEVENLILEHLRRIRASIDVLGLEVGDIKMRLVSVEEGQAQFMSQIGDVHVQLGRLASQIAGQGKRFDRADERLARIERRLDLVEADPH